MFDKLLIADRGETAVRILRTCRTMGIRTVAVFSEADRDLDYLRLADESMCIGPAPLADSYLNVPSILSVAELTDAEAIHPGSSPLAESAHFAEIVATSGFQLVGPGPEVLGLIADRARTRSAMRDVGLLCVPDNEAPLPGSPDEIVALAKNLGFPVIVKGGMGHEALASRVVHSPAALLLALNQMKAELRATFSHSPLYFEHYFANCRHIGVQILADGEGNAIHLGTRDCSIRHEHRELLVEAPASNIAATKLEEICCQCVDACLALKYRGVATFEMLYQEGCFYFLSITPKLDSAHSVTEVITGVDIVQEQIRIATRQGLQRTQAQVKMRGHAIECHINAEHPFRFIPSTGQIGFWLMPGGPGIRVDSHCNANDFVPKQYPVLLGNLVAQGETRTQTIAHMRRALAETVIEGVRTNIRLHQGIVDDDGFCGGGVHIGYLDEELAKRYRPGTSPRGR